jgi:FkbM family methyltransferase
MEAPIETRGSALVGVLAWIFAGKESWTVGIANNFLTMVKNPGLIAPFGSWVSSKLLLGKPPTVSPYDGLKLSGWTSFSEFQFRRGGIPAEERALLGWCRKQISGPSVALDVGGNIGLFALSMAVAGFEKVYSFEPVPFNFTRFEQNMKLNPEQAARITVTHAAASEAKGVMPFAVSETSPGTCHILTNDAAPAGYYRIDVPVLTLDEFCAERKVDRVGFLKIDVEGYEKFVLRGASRLLGARAIDFVFLEFIHKAFWDAGYNPMDLVDMLDEAGYRPVESESGMAGRPMSREQLAVETPGLIKNVLWVKKTGA